MLPSLVAKLDEWHIEIEERDGQICIRDNHVCESIGEGQLAKLGAIQRLLDGERQRQKKRLKNVASAEQAAAHVREQFGKPMPPPPRDR
jgi:hypothetical protein